MSDYVSRPDGGIQILWKRRRDAPVAAETTQKRVCLDGCKLNSGRQVYNDTRFKNYNVRKKRPEPEKHNSDGDSGASGSSTGQDLISIASENSLRTEELEMVDLGRHTAADKYINAGDSRGSETGLPNWEIIEPNPFLMKKLQKRKNPKGDLLGERMLLKAKIQPIEVSNLLNFRYEVHSIKDHSIDRYKKRWFLVHWKGWSSIHDSWELEKKMKRTATPALILLISKFFLEKGPKFHSSARNYLRHFVKKTIYSPDPQDYLILSKLAREKIPVRNGCVMPNSQGFYRKKIKERQRKKTLLNGSLEEIERFLGFAIERFETIDRYQKQSEAISAKEPPRAEIVIENLKNCESFPDFEYITDLEVADGLKVKSEGGSCRCKNSNSCKESAHRSCTVKAYENGLLTSENAIYECNSQCPCGLGCPNRVIQLGTQLKLTIFMTVSRGWGVKARTYIRKGTFIGEYLGELITFSQAASRDSLYLFDLKPEKKMDTKYTIDAARFGNFTRFFNHSCKPNMRVSYAYIENRNKYAPRIAFFAKEDISAGEELTFDYHMEASENGSGHPSQKKCLCGAQECRNPSFSRASFSGPS